MPVHYQNETAGYYGRPRFKMRISRRWFGLAVFAEVEEEIGDGFDSSKYFI